MLRATTYVALALLSCSSPETTKEQRTFSDEAGRACTATIEKSSPSAPVLGEQVSCEGQPKQCSAGSVPCFQLSPDAESALLKNCPACCKGSSSSITFADCSPVVCETQADCVYENASCEANHCTCPDGYCDD